MNKTWIFDYDDTLAWNQHYYSLAQAKFVEWVIGKLCARSPDAQTIINLEVELDKATVSAKGFSTDSFPSALRETYSSICQTLGIIAKEDDLQAAYKIGMSVFDEEKYKKEGLVNGAVETLDFLVAQQDELILLTKGDVAIQEKKIRATGCRKWFNDNLYIVSKKNASVVGEIVGKRDKSRVWHVGNSIRSDVEPALEVGIGVVYIPCETWAFEREHKGKPNNPRLITFNVINEIIQKYVQLK
ncbi:HAD family hydrolase [Candidatus Woesearchaeota archaeon]|nr:HAD family hydrolase [Candidatus Woesearchaeota archaeon]